MKDGRHLRLICKELQKVTQGLTKNLLINLPPRHCKSMLVSIFWPVWEWISRPQEQFLCVSYDLALTQDLARRARDLIKSEWFQARWGKRFTLSEDQDAKGHYTNNKLGARISITVKGGATGKGGTRIIVDDPHNVKSIESDAEREGVLYWWGNVIKSRKNNPDAAFVVVMQRCHEEDLTGHILETEGPLWRHICLPARYEEGANSDYDPRTEEGEALWPEMYPTEVLDKLQETMDPYAVLGQYQQRPTSRKGGAIDTAWFKYVNARPAGAQWVRAWDFAGSDGKGDHTASLLVGSDEQGKIYLDGEEGIYGQWGPGEVELTLQGIAIRDGKGIPIRIPQDPAQAGKSQVFQMITKLLVGWTVFAKVSSGSKLARAGGWIAQARVGNVYLVNGPWVAQFLKEAKMFPRGKADDYIDTVSAGFDELLEHGGGGAGFGLSKDDFARFGNAPKAPDPLARKEDPRSKNRGGVRWNRGRT